MFNWQKIPKVMLNHWELKIVLMLLIDIVFWNRSFSQNTISYSYPEIKQTYFLNTTHAVNRLGLDHNFSTNYIYQQYFNVLSDIYFVNASGFVKLGKGHQLGMIFNSLKEGPYIGKTSANLHYAYVIRVFKKSTLSAGIGFGFNSFKYNGALVGVAGQAFAPDLNIDLLFRSKVFVFYYALNQLTSSIITPYNSGIKLHMFQEFRTNVSIQMGREFSLNPMSHVLLYETKNSTLGGGASITAFSKFSAGVMTYQLNTLLYQVGLILPHINSWELGLNASYKQLIGNQTGNLLENSIEIGLNISKKNAANVYSTEE